jgi:cytochrome c biogenesis protein CcmG, thiol:disulfide interchange protein DsbE
MPLPKFRVSTVLAVLMLSATSALGAGGETAPLLPQWQGKVVLLDFWASWCKPCRESFPWMNDLQRRYGNDLVIVAVNLDQDRDLAEQFLAQTPASFRIEYDAKGALATKLDVSTMPMSFLIDRDGRIRERHRGFRTTQRADREHSIAALLKE